MHRQLWWVQSITPAAVKNQNDSETNRIAAEIVPKPLSSFFHTHSYYLTLCSETLKPGRSSVYHQAVPQTLRHTGSVLPSCHTSTQLHTGPDPTLAQALACLSDKMGGKKGWIFLPQSTQYTVCRVTKGCISKLKFVYLSCLVLVWWGLILWVLLNFSLNDVFLKSPTS